MTIMLGAIDLGDNILLRGLDADPIAIDVQRSDSGVAQILIADLEAGEELSLYGWFTQSMQDQVLALVRTKQPVALSHPRYTGTVLVIGTTMEPVFEYVDQIGTDYLEGSITILRIS